MTRAVDLAKRAVITTEDLTNIPSGAKNLIINGDMRIAQRGTSATSHSSDAYTTVDRWKTRVNGLGVWTVSQDTDVPSGQGFSNSVKWDCTTADASPAVTDFCIHEQRLEGQMLQHLKYGTSSAESVTVSFWVKSNKTGSYTIGLFCQGNLKHIESSYIINVADTWEKKTVTFVGDTVSALANDNSDELKLWFWLGAGTNFSSGTHATSWSSYAQADVLVSGQVNLADSTSNYINITGVQLEVGDTATPFEHRPYDMELARCQRYYNNIGKVGHSAYSAVGVMGFIFPTPMRATPTATFSYLGTTNRVYNIQTGAQSTLSSPTVIVGTTGVHNMYAFSPTNWAVAIGTGFHIEWTLSAEL